MRNLVVLIDGTWVAASDDEKEESRSNVYKINLYIPTIANYNGQEIDQIVLYEPGIGSKTQGYKFLGGIFAYRIEYHIQKIYINICSNFDFTLGLYLFGFSRGSVIARALAGLISKCGILKAERIYSYKTVYEIYQKAKLNEDDLTFLYENCFQNVSINCLGVFDTVYGGLHSGASYRRRLHFADGNLSLPSKVRHGIQILAADEDRFLFRPLIWSGSTKNQKMCQVWLPGSHGDIGGTFNDGVLGDVSLLTMIELILKNEHNTLGFVENEKESKFGIKNYTIDNLRNSISKNIEKIVVHSTPITHKLRNYVRESKDDVACLHPIVEQIKDRDIHIKGKQGKYKISDNIASKRYSETQKTILNESWGGLKVG